MKEQSYAIIANFISKLSKFDTVCKSDLEFAIDTFLLEEEYEKCAVLKQLRDKQHFDNTKQSNSESILNLLDKINKLDTSNKDMAHFKNIFLQFNRELFDFIDKIEEVYSAPLTMMQNIQKRINILALEIL